MENNPLWAMDPEGLQVVTFGHGARHLHGTGLSQSAVEGEITKVIVPILPTVAPGASFWGTLTVNGTRIQYRAMGNSCGAYVGTYFPW